jgi:hypothetical protein
LREQTTRNVLYDQGRIDSLDLFSRRYSLSLEIFHVTVVGSKLRIQTFPWDKSASVLDIVFGVGFGLFLISKVLVFDFGALARSALKWGSALWF